jgi:hypothetical protein
MNKVLGFELKVLADMGGHGGLTTLNDLRGNPAEDNPFGIDWFYKNFFYYDVDILFNLKRTLDTNFLAQD